MLQAYRPILLCAFLSVFACLGGLSKPASAQNVFVQSLAQAVSSDPDLTAYYQSVGYAPVWTGRGGVFRKRVNAFTDALAQADAHGLPAARYDAQTLRQLARRARSDQDKAIAEATLSRAFLDYAQDIQSGVVNPSAMSKDIHRKAPHRDPVQLLASFSKASAPRFLAQLPPQTASYTALVEEKARLEALLAKGDPWGQRVSARSKLGDSGPAVAALATRLAAMGYGDVAGQTSFDAELDAAVKRFQSHMGLTPDGVVGPMTLREINKGPEHRLAKVMASMERERWMNYPLGDRHIWVNIPEYVVRVVDNGKTTFSSTVVVGKDEKDHRTPEFSDVMEYMVINPTWNVPRSIAVKEYLPMLKEDPNAVGHLDLLDGNNNVVSRASVDFSSLSEDVFPYRLREPPSTVNALGLVKFMFPNRHNIYLHDTPHKSLFGRYLRAYSHGCIRVSQPFDFAYVLLDPQTNNPEATFRRYLNTKVETTVTLREPVPVHLVYRTAISGNDGKVRYLYDLYDRDPAVFSALREAGVRFGPVRS